MGGWGREKGCLDGASVDHANPHSFLPFSPPHHMLVQVSGLWILLGATVAAALIIYLAGQLTLCAARRVANTQAYKQSARRMKSLRSSITMRRYSTSASVKRRTSSSGRDATAICRADLEDASDEQGGSEVSVAVNDVLVRVQQLQQLLAKKPG